MSAASVKSNNSSISYYVAMANNKRMAIGVANKQRSNISGVVSA